MIKIGKSVGEAVTTTNPSFCTDSAKVLSSVIKQKIMLSVVVVLGMCLVFILLVVNYFFLSCRSAKLVEKRRRVDSGYGPNKTAEHLSFKSRNKAIAGRP